MPLISQAANLWLLEQWFLLIFSAMSLVIPVVMLHTLGSMSLGFGFSDKNPWFEELANKSHYLRGRKISLEQPCYEILPQAAIPSTILWFGTISQVPSSHHGGRNFIQKIINKINEKLTLGWLFFNKESFSRLRWWLTSATSKSPCRSFESWTPAAFRVYCMESSQLYSLRSQRESSIILCWLS